MYVYSGCISFNFEKVYMIMSYILSSEILMFSLLMATYNVVVYLLTLSCLINDQLIFEMVEDVHLNFYLSEDLFVIY